MPAASATARPPRIAEAAVRPPRRLRAATSSRVAGAALRRSRPAESRPWLDPAVVALSFQRADGEWRYCPWLIGGRDDLYDPPARSAQPRPLRGRHI